MAEQQETIKFNRYRYKPIDVVLTAKQTEFAFRDGLVTYINYIVQYEDMRYPIIQIGIQMEMKEISLIYANKDTAKLKINILQEMLDDNDKVVASTPFLTHTFSIVPMYTKKTYITDPNATEDDLGDPMRSLQQFECYLVDMDIDNWFSMELGFMPELISYPQLLDLVFYRRNIPGSIRIVTPPMQSGKLSMPLVPVDTLIGNVRYINRYYGLYSCNPIIFHDLKYLYCIDKRKPNISLENPEKYSTITFVLANPDSAEYQVHGSNDDSKNMTHWINLNLEPQVEVMDQIEVASKMGTLLSVSNGGNVSRDTIVGTATRLNQIRSQHALSVEQYRSELVHGEIVNLVANDAAVYFLKPYKDYRFAIDSSYTDIRISPSTIYRISKWSLNIRRSGLDTYTHQVGISVYNTEF